MKLTGIIEEVFGSSIVFRGYTTLKNLVDISKKPSYQRNEDSKRLESIENYIKNTQYRFFPELLFGWQIEKADILADIRENSIKTIKINSDITIKKQKFELKQNTETDLKTISIEIKNATQFLNRIDGNHRLCAIAKIIGENTDIVSQYGNITVPFSILMHPKNEDSEKKETAFFYLINSKSEPLTDEQNLRSIFEGNRFDNNEKTNLSIVKDIEKYERIVSTLKSISFVKEWFNDESYSFALSIYNNLDDNTSVDNIQTVIKEIEILFYRNELPQNRNIIISLIVSYLNHDKIFFERYRKWINNNQLQTIKNIRPKELLGSFEGQQKKFKVFVAMPYISHQRVNDYNKLFKEVLKEISEKESVFVELIPIMRFRGESQRIDYRLIEKIKECDIFIADLTTCNDNVIFEIGLAEGNNKPMVLIKAEGDGSKLPFDEAKLNPKKNVPFDMDKLQWIPYDGIGYYNHIKSIMRNNIPEILKQKYNAIPSSTKY